MAKDKLLTGLRVYLDGYNVSGDTRSVDSIDGPVGEIDMLGVSETVRNYLADRMHPVGVRGYKAMLNDTAASGAHTLLVNPETGHEVSVLLGSAGAAPVVGDIAYVLGAVQMSDQAAMDAASAVLQTDFLPDAGVTNTQAWGVVLSPETSMAATTNRAAVNNGAQSTNGYSANLHITASGGGIWSFLIEGSTTGAYAGEETTTHTFTANGSAITSEHGSGTGTVKQYQRLRAVRTSGTVTAVVTFARG